MAYVRKKTFGSGLFAEPNRSTTVLARSVLRRRSRSEPESVRSSLVMHNVVVDGRRTTVRLEPVIWDALQSIARQEEVTLHDLVSDINRRRTASSLSSGIRAYVVIYLSAGLRDALSARLSQDH
jgi:predicted DNA-binding ribbon-helix-helix protein